jgi:hypothetical protein
LATAKKKQRNLKKKTLLVFGELITLEFVMESSGG